MLFISQSRTVQATTITGSTADLTVVQVTISHSQGCIVDI